VLDLSLFDMASLVVHFFRDIGRRIAKRQRPHSLQQVDGPARIEFRDGHGDLILSVTILQDDAQNG
jgi:hypothetical protein